MRIPLPRRTALPAARGADLRGRRRLAAVRLVAVAAAGFMALAACSTSEPEVVTTTLTAGGTQVTAPTLTPTTGTDTSTSGPDETSDSPSTTSSPADAIRITATPAFGSRNVGPNEPISLMAFHAELANVTMSGDDGSVIKGEIGEGNRSWKATDTLKYGVTYTISGEAVGTNGSSKTIDGRISTVKPTETVRAAIQIPEGATVGVAAPIVLTFFNPIQDKSVVKDKLHVTINDGQPIEGAWVWMQDEQVQADGPKWSRYHFRPKEFWPAHAKVHVEADLYGLNYGNGWGRENITRDFEIGPKLVVKAEVDTHRLLVLKDDEVIKNYPVSYGVPATKDEGRTTVSGIHVITEKKPGEFEMCNPKYGYCGVKEYWGVRINNNGEFIHVNPQTEKAGILGKANVSHGCVNMSMRDGKEFFDMVYYGVPVDVEGTGVPMTERDYIWDWSKTWPEWKALSERS